MTRHPRTGAQIRIGVMGAALGEFPQEILDRCRELGNVIAQRGLCLVTGACPGLPQQAAMGAKEAGGHTIGISPARSLREHVELYASPYAEHDVLIYTGLGLMGRELVNIRTSDIVIVAGGQSGTLGEFAIAYEEGKLIGVLQGTGGIAEAIPAISSVLTKWTGAVILTEQDPTRLVDRLVEHFIGGAYRCPSEPEYLPQVTRRPEYLPQVTK